MWQTLPRKSKFDLSSLEDFEKNLLSQVCQIILVQQSTQLNKWFDHIAWAQVSEPNKTKISSRYTKSMSACHQSFPHGPTWESHQHQDLRKAIASLVVTLTDACPEAIQATGKGIKEPYPPWNQHFRIWKWMVGICWNTIVSFWVKRPIFRGDLLVSFRGVYLFDQENPS